MHSPVRKLIRIASLLITLIILFNFFGYFLVRSKSAENENISRMAGYATRQRALSQTITKDAVLLLSLSEHRIKREDISNRLRVNLIEFKNNSVLLRSNLDDSETASLSDRP